MTGESTEFGPHSLPPWGRYNEEGPKLVSVQVGGKVYTDYITGVTATTGATMPRPRPPLWRRTIRALTPRRWRKPELWTPVGYNSRPSTLVVTLGEGDALERHRQRLEDVQKAIQTLTHDQKYEIGRDLFLGELHTWCPQCFQLHPAGKHVETGDTAE